MRFVVSAGIAFSAASTPAALAANLVPNPNLASCSGTVPSNWSADSIFTTVNCATIAGHTSLQAATQVWNGGGRSTCVNAALAAGQTAAAAFSYCTTEPTVTQVLFGVSFYTGPGCTGVITTHPPLFSSSPPLLGAWTPVLGMFPVPTGTKSVSFFVNILCTLSMGGGTGCSVPGATAYFDDLFFEATPLAVAVAGLSAARSGRTVLVHWRLTSTTGLLGFHVYRDASGARVRINSRLIPVHRGSAYSFVDRELSRPSARYWIQAVNLDGSHSWYGPTKAARNGQLTPGDAGVSSREEPQARARSRG